MKMGFYAIATGYFNMIAGEQINIAGMGMVDTFGDKLPVSFIEAYIQLPNKNSSNKEASFDFDVPAEISGAPFLYVIDPDFTRGYYPFFTHLGGVRWRVTLWGYGGRRVIHSSNGRVDYLDWEPVWKEPIMKSNMRIMVGGYRG